MPESYFVKGLLMGIVFGVPAGAIGVLTIRNSLEKGFIAGFLTGFGSSVADLCYAVICVFGISLISDIILGWQFPLGIAGGLVIIALGILNLFKKIKDASNSKSVKQNAGNFFTSFLIAIMNPATILSFFAAFAAFGIAGYISPTAGSALITGIFLGTCCWWLGLSAGVSFFREKINKRIYLILNRILGSLLVILGIILLTNTLFTGFHEGV